MSVAERMVETSHGKVAVSESSGKGPATLLVHGNSSSKAVFAGQLASPLGEAHRLIAIDLLGNGASDNAIDPARTYSLPGLADAAIETLKAMGIERASVFGWSLGGHVAMEMIVRFPGLVGLMVSGAPPISPTLESIQAGFKPNPLVMLIGKQDFTAEEVAGFGQGTYGALFDDRFRKTIERADGRMRRMTFENLMAGIPADEKRAAQEASMPIAFVNGAEDPFVNLDYVAGLRCRNLWEDHCFVLRGLGHVPFLQEPKTFNPIFGRFLDDMAKRASLPKSVAA